LPYQLVLDDRIRRNRGAADVETAGDFGFADSGVAQFADPIGVQCGSKWSAQTFAVLSRMSKPGTDAFAKDFSFELSENSEKSGHGAAGGRGQIESLGKRDEADAEMLQFLQSGKQVGDRSPPAVQTPDQYHVDLPAPGGFDQPFPHLPL
jgi:hypothetical protein